MSMSGVFSLDLALYLQMLLMRALYQSSCYEPRISRRHRPAIVGDRAEVVQTNEPCGDDCSMSEYVPSRLLDSDPRTMKAFHRVGRVGSRFDWPRIVPYWQGTTSAQLAHPHVQTFDLPRAAPIGNAASVARLHGVRRRVRSNRKPERRRGPDSRVIRVVVASHVSAAHVGSNGARPRSSGARRLRGVSAHQSNARASPPSLSLPLARPRVSFVCSDP